MSSNDSEIEETRQPLGRGFLALMVAQFMGALNDNVVRLFVALIITEQLVTDAGGEGYLSLAQALFYLPYILISTFAGFLADRFSKTSVLRWVKGLEVVVAVLALVCLRFGSVWPLFFVVLMMGIHSALFSPAKYGILAEMLERKQLSRGNGYIELWTFVGIIGGTAIAGLLKGFSGRDYTTPGVAMILIAVAGLLATFFIPRFRPANESAHLEYNPLREIIPLAREVRETRALFLTVLAVSYFWFLGSLFHTNVLTYAKLHLMLNDISTGLLMTVMGLGTGLGAVMAGRISAGKVELGLVPLGGFGLAVGCIVLSLGPHIPGAVCSLLILGISAGFFVVPLNSYFQARSPDDKRGLYLGFLNVCSFSAMLFSSAFYFVATELFHLRSTEIFFWAGILTIGTTIYITKVIPDMLLRCINWTVSHLVYSVSVRGKLNVPETGGALLVCNHISYADPPLLLAAIERPIRFLMYRPIYEHWLIHPFAKAMRAIPVAPEDGPRAIAAALAEAREAIKNGDLVCIFAEGALTRLGRLLPFQRGFEKIMKGVEKEPVIPVHLDQLWGSIFSFRNGKFFWKVPKEIPYPVTLTFGKPLPAATKAPEVRTVIQELGSDAFNHRQRRHQLLDVGFVHQAKSTLFRTCCVDSTGKDLTFLTALSGALLLSKLWRLLHKRGEMVGVLLPPSVGGVLANISLMFAGCVPVNLNFTASKESLRSAIQQCEMKRILTSQKFIEKLEMEKLPEMEFLEDILSQITRGKKIRYLLVSLLMPASLIERLFLARGRSREDTATIIFSSGSTGEPKGVMLSHGNICSNLEALYEVYQVNQRDVVLGVLPFFHSFGFTATMWFPLLAGIKAVYHSNPVDAQVVGELAERHRVTIFLSTPTFLLSYMRRCEPKHFSTLRILLVGAEKLKERVATAFQEKFGILPLEGYGCTELSPVAMLNLPDVSLGATEQAGNKPGSVGQPLPGVAVRIVDPESFQPLEINQPGLMLIKGPNVMKGYLGRPEKTAEVVKDGWYVTGDIALVDDEGFVTITDRLSRFSKIGGEMVPHVRVEEEIQKAIGAVEPVAVVTAVSDDKKGERLIVLLKQKIDIGEVIKKLGEQGLPNLWIPKRDSFFEVDSFPVLGTGKLDLRGIKERARELAGSAPVDEKNIEPAKAPNTLPPSTLQ